MDKISNLIGINIVKDMFATRNKWDHKRENIKTSMYARFVNFQRWIVRKSIVVVQRVVFTTWRKSFSCATSTMAWIIYNQKKISKDLITFLITQSGSRVYALSKTYKFI